MLLTSDQMIDRPNKEPHLGLGPFTSSGLRIVRIRMDVFVIFRFLSENGAIKLNVRLNAKTRIKVR